MQISVVIIVKNESDNLKLSLPELDWCKDIIVVDDYSDDDSVKIAESFGAKVFQRKFDGFGTQKQFAVSKAENNWILNIDADEVISPTLKSELKQIQLEENYDAFDIPVRHVFMGRVFKYGKESKYYHLRLFNKLKANFNNATVHEKVEGSTKTGKLNGVLLHYSYKDLKHYFHKFNIYTEAGAHKLKNAGKSRPLILCVLSFPIYFIKHFLFYGNILNGKQGFMWSYLTAWYHTVKYLKLYELNNRP